MSVQNKGDVLTFAERGLITFCHCPLCIISVFTLWNILGEGVVCDFYWWFWVWVCLFVFFFFHFDCQLMFCDMTICFSAASFWLSTLGSVRSKGLSGYADVFRVATEALEDATSGSLLFQLLVHFVCGCKACFSQRVWAVGSTWDPHDNRDVLNVGWNKKKYKLKIN